MNRKAIRFQHRFSSSLGAAMRGGVWRPTACQAFGRQVRLHEAPRLSAIRQDSLGRQISATDGTFHCGGPSRRGPISRKKEIAKRSALGGSPAIGAGLRGKRRSSLLHDRRLDQLRLAGVGQDLRQFGEAKIDDLLAGALHKRIGSADHRLQISSFRRASTQARFIENPLRRAIQQRDKWLRHDIAVEPEMHAGDRRRFQISYLPELEFAGNNALREKPERRFVRNGEYVKIRVQPPPAIQGEACYLAAFFGQHTHGRPARYFPAPLLDRRTAAFVEFTQRDAWNADDVSRASAKKGLPENVETVACLDSREFFVQGADEDYRPESGNSCFALPVCTQPIQHALPCSVTVVVAPAAPGNCQHCLADALLFRPAEGGIKGKRRREVQRGR